MMTAAETTQNRKINPKKFAMWIAIGSIIMMFGGLTSGYLVRQSQGNWEQFKLPVAFYISTAVILLSSLTIVMAKRAFKKRQMPFYRILVSATFLLGIAFTLLQYFGFKELLSDMKWTNNVAFQYLVVIILVHALHIVGGVAALMVLWLQTYSKKVKTYSTTALDIAATYWHFVDILWLYLFVFFLLNR